MVRFVWVKILIYEVGRDYWVSNVSVVKSHVAYESIKGHVNQCPGHWLRKLKKESFKMKISLFMLLKS
jgi:hypothetical protein